MLFAYPKILFWIIPLFIVLLILMLRDFVKIDHDLRANASFMKNRKIFLKLLTKERLHFILQTSCRLNYSSMLTF